MPRFDGTGPEGRGSMTGRGFGQCNTAVVTNNTANVKAADTAKDTPTENVNVPINNLDNNNFRGLNFNRPMGNFNRGQGRALNVGRGRGGLGLGRGRGCGFNGRGNRGNFNN